MTSLSQRPISMLLHHPLHYSLYALAGGSPAASASTLNQSAVLQAESGLWSHQLASGNLPRTCAPGLTRGLWGAWAQSENDSNFHEIDEEEQARKVAMERSERALLRQRLLRQQQSTLMTQHHPLAKNLEDLKLAAGTNKDGQDLGERKGDGGSFKTPALQQQTVVEAGGGQSLQQDQAASVNSGRPRAGVFGNVWGAEEDEEEEDMQGKEQAPSVKKVRWPYCGQHHQVQMLGHTHVGTVSNRPVLSNLGTDLVW